MIARRILCLTSILTLLALPLVLAACGSSEEDKDVSEGIPVELGELQYNVLFSRILNPYDVEDREYLVGQLPPAADEVYFGVFVEVLNKDKESPQTIPPDWTVTDTERNEFHPVPSESPYALPLGEAVEPEDQVPALDSSAQLGPIKGSLVLFRITDRATEARPLELEIPGEGGPARVELDI
jgi:hypothetical protein